MESWSEYNTRTNKCGEDLLDMLISKCEVVVYLYSNSGKSEVYLPVSISTQLLHAFEQVANFRVSEELLLLPYLKEYTRYDIGISQKYLKDKQGISCDSDAMQYLIRVADSTRGTFLFKYEKEGDKSRKK